MVLSITGSPRDFNCEPPRINARPTQNVVFDTSCMTCPEYQFFEYACHEGNYAMRNILSAERAAEKKGAGSGESSQP